MRGLENDMTIAAYTVDQFGAAYNLGRTRIYQEISAGRLRIMKVGARTLISREAADEWRRNLEAHAERDGAVAA